MDENEDVFNVALTGIKEKEDGLILTHTQDITPMLHDAYEARKLTRKWRHGKKGIIGDHIGRVPTLVFEDWVKMGMDPKDKKQICAMLELYPQYKTTVKTL